MSAKFDHCGFVVSRLDEALQFFVDELGAREIRRGEVSDPDGGQMAGVFGVHPRAASRFVFVSFDDVQIEFLEWQGADRVTESPGNSDAGARHLALRMSDLQGFLDKLRTMPGFTVRERSPRGFHYVRTPFGLELQLFQQD